MDRADFPPEMPKGLGSYHLNSCGGSSSTAPQAHPASHAIQKELDHLQVPRSGWEVISPGIEAMLSDQIGEAKGMGIALPILLHFLPKRRDILRVFEDGDPKRGLVGGDPLESFQEFVPFQEDSALSVEQVG